MHRQFRIAIGPRLLFIGTGIAIALFAGCSRPAVRIKPVPTAVVQTKIPVRMGYSIQAGAFSKVNNAAKLSSLLQEKGLSATYFAAGHGLYKVRLGNFPTREFAQKKAEELRKSGIIDDFYIVKPEQYAIAKLSERGESFLRKEIVRTARSFLGIPYLWGGTSAATGFDCSGLTMTVYQLNGIDLPRSSKEQFEMGGAANRDSLQEGDLVFFSIGGKQVSHVGIYAGSQLFIHAAENGKRIRIDSLEQDYYSRHFFGGRTYLPGETL
jgi:cell wall-associated NlpC family hydrolase